MWKRQRARKSGKQDLEVAQSSFPGTLTSSHSEDWRKSPQLLSGGGESDHFEVCLFSQPCLDAFSHGRERRTLLDEGHSVSVQAHCKIVIKSQDCRVFPFPWPRHLAPFALPPISGTPVHQQGTVTERMPPLRTHLRNLYGNQSTRETKTKLATTNSTLELTPSKINKNFTQKAYVPQCLYSVRCAHYQQKITSHANTMTWPKVDIYDTLRIFEEQEHRVCRRIT